MKDNEANEFYNRIVEGKEYYETVTLTHESGAKLEDVQLHPVDKQALATVIERLPEALFEAVEGADTPEEAEEMLEDGDGGGGGLDAMNSDTVQAFEDLVAESARHDNLTNTQMTEVIEQLDFEVLFELGGKIIDMSFENSGAIKDFQEAA